MRRNVYLDILSTAGILNWVLVIMGFIIPRMMGEPQEIRAFFDPFSLYIKFSFVLPIISLIPFSIKSNQRLSVFCYWASILYLILYVLAYFYLRYQIANA